MLAYSLLCRLFSTAESTDSYGHNLMSLLPIRLLGIDDLYGMVPFLLAFFENWVEEPPIFDEASTFWCPVLLLGLIIVLGVIEDMGIGIITVWYSCKFDWT